MQLVAVLVGSTLTAVLAAVVGALLWRAGRRRRVIEALRITTPNGIAEERFVPIGGIDQWIQIREKTVPTRSC